MTFPDDMELAVALSMAETASARQKAIETLLRSWLEDKRYLADASNEDAISPVAIHRGNPI